MENVSVVPVVYGDVDRSFEMYSDEGDGYDFVDGQGKLEIFEYRKSTGKIEKR